MSEPSLPIASRVSMVDRASHLRNDAAALTALAGRAQFFEVSGGKVRIEQSQTIERFQLKIVANDSLPAGDRFFLGLSSSDHQPYFAIHREAIDNEQEQSEFKSLREVATDLSPLQLELAMHAIALSNWHHAHPRCSRCGNPTRSDLGGAVRVCDVDQMQHHPRTDGAVIVLVKDQDDRILLGHQPVWPDGRFSTFAGFLEPGETFEQCVAREVREESGVEVSEISYLGSQPWPFPASVMIAFSALTDNPDKATPDGSEITEVRWFSRDELRQGAQDGTLLLPPKISVARQMIEMWLGEVAPGGETWR